MNDEDTVPFAYDAEACNEGTSLPDSLLYSLKFASIQTENCGCLPKVYPETPRNSRKGLLPVPVNPQLSIAIQRLLDLFFLIL